MSTAQAAEGREHYLPDGLPRPAAANDGLEQPYWAGTRRHELMVQRCHGCRTFQWGPEWICHRCRSSDVGWASVDPRGHIYSWERVWYPVHPALQMGVPYIVVLVELPGAGGIRMVGNLLGRPLDAVEIGSPVDAVFEHHADADSPFTLVQWRRSE